jgi:hypothetical protein
MVRYIDMLSAPAKSIDPSVDARTFKAIESSEDGAPFKYIDTASSRAGISEISEKLRLDKVAIVGVGGTGSYVLDLAAKCPVKEIHLFDGDTFLQHNAFRSPGAASVAELNAKQTKVDYFAGIYSKMRHGVVPHPYNIDSSKAQELAGFDFVFVCLDKDSAKRPIVEKLEELGIAFTDVGMGVWVVDEAKCLAGVVRVTTSTKDKRDHVRDKQRIAFNDPAVNDDYHRNIQIADLNALNAAIAVIKWKKLFGFYQDLRNEHHTGYSLNDNFLQSDDFAVRAA